MRRINWATWLNCSDTIINAYRKHEAFEKMITTYEHLYRNMWQEPGDSISLVTLAESNRQMARYYYRTLSNYSKSASLF
jgi:hypothetical protein